MLNLKKLNHYRFIRHGTIFFLNFVWVIIIAPLVEGKGRKKYDISGNTCPVACRI